MAQTIIIKNGTGSIANSDVVKGELAINTNTGNLYYGNTAGNVSSSFTFVDVTASRFVGDGSGITGVTADWDGAHNGDAQITGSLLVTGAITASGAISSSGTITAARVYPNGPSGPFIDESATGNNIGSSTGFYAATDITASGDISASGVVYGSRLYEGGNQISTIYSPLAGNANLATVGTITTGVWDGDIIASSKLQNQSGTNTGDQDLSSYALQTNVSSSFALQANVSASFAPIASPTFTGTVAGVTKTHVGLANADNTSDAGKPISDLTQTALDFKAPLANPSFTVAVTASGDISASGVIYSDNEEVLYNGSFRASTLSTVNWVGPDQKGPTDYTWDKDYGVSGEGSHTMAHRYYLNAGHMVPYDCILTGFQSALRNHNSGDDSNGALSMSLFYRLDANMDWNESSGNQNKNNILFACGNGYGHGDTIKAYNSYKVEASCAIHLTKGSMIYPRIARTDNSAAQDGSGTGGGNTDGTYNIFIKRRKS